VARVLNNINLAKKLVILYVLLVSIPTVVVAYFLTSRLHSVSLRSTFELCTAAVTELGGAVEHRLETYKKMIDALVSDEYLRRYLGLPEKGVFSYGVERYLGKWYKEVQGNSG